MTSTLIGYHTPDGKGGYLRPRNQRHVQQRTATVAQFADHPDEWEEWVEWMKALPFYLDLGGLRVDHPS